MDIFAQLATKIIEHQESIIGPVAIQQAEQVEGIKLDWSKHQVELNGDQPTIVDKLVEQFQILFGPIAVEASKEATAQLISQVPKDRVPKSLQ